MSKARTLILTSSKTLQTQYSEWFRDLGILDIRGRSNYTCIATEVGGEFYEGNLATTVEHGPCQYGNTCTLRQAGCSYYDLTRRAKHASLVLANYDLWFYSNMFSDGFGPFSLVLADEAHEAANKLSSAMTITLPANYQHIIGDMPTRSKDPIYWAQWAANLYPRVANQYRTIKEQMKHLKPAAKKKINITAVYKAATALERMSAMTNDWLVMQNTAAMSFSPVWVDKDCESLFYNGANKVVLASATIRPSIYRLLGIDKTNVDFFDYPSSFPVRNRPIYFWPIVSMKYDMSGDDMLSMVGAIDEILDGRLDRKSIIHSVSFALQKFIVSNSKFRHLMLTNRPGENIDAFVKRFKRISGPCIMVSPSVGTGHDFAGDDCRTIIIPKVPFADSSHPIQQARAKEDPTIGIYEAGMLLEQFSGRHVRSEQDWGETFILDSVFSMFLTRYRYMIHNWWWDGVQIIDKLPEVKVK